MSLLLAALPAIVVAIFAAASWTMASMSHARLIAIKNSLEGANQAALDRYLSQGTTIEARWLVTRTFGIALSALLFLRTLPLWLTEWRYLIAALLALVAYSIPSEIGRALAPRFAEKSAPVMLRVLRPLELLLAPIADPIGLLGRWIGQRFEAPVSTTPGVIETEVGLIVSQGEQNGAFGADQSRIIRNVLNFGGATADKLMIPRTQMVALAADFTLERAVVEVAKAGHARYPVFRDAPDNVVGVLYAKDLLDAVARNELKAVRVESIMRQPVPFVPESQLAVSLLNDMQNGQHRLAVVVDEFGGVSGIVTLEDLLGEIVGRAPGVRLDEEASLTKIADGRFMADGGISIEELGKEIGSFVPFSTGYNTLAGYIVAELGRVPVPGDTLITTNAEFIVREADERRVTKVEIVPRTPIPSLPPRSSTRATAAQ